MSALVSGRLGHFVFKDVAPLATWFGLTLIIAGELVIQFWLRGESYLNILLLNLALDERK